MNPDELEKLIELDSRGFLIMESESAGEFLQRIGETGKVYAAFENELAEKGKVRVFDTFEVSAADRIAPELSLEAADITRELYGFEVSHVPGFYLTREIGLFWGGCLIGDPEENFAVFLLRNAFRKQQRFLNYRREELLAHELCHSVRHVLNESMLEEYFAYQTSPSPLRRYLGNCFISDRDAWGFLLPVLLLPLAEVVKALWLPDFPSWIFWILALLYPLYLLCRNHCSRKLVKKAAANLSAGAAVRVNPVLFRCTYAELQEFAAARPEEVAAIVEAKAESSPRWRVIVERIFQHNEEEQDNENRIEN